MRGLKTFILGFLFTVSLVSYGQNNQPQSEYPDDCLYHTGFAPLGNGKPSILFSSPHKKVIDLHFSWIKQYEIDGVALQRFLGETKTTAYRQQRDSITVNIMKASEKYGRIFYLMYDMSANDTAFFQSDLLHLEKDPLDQYFLTTSADESYVSSDFYLRLTGQAARLMKG